MAGPITVQGPDGQRYQFPEGTDPAVMKQAMAKRYPKNTPQSVFGDKAMGVLQGAFPGSPNMVAGAQAPAPNQNILPGMGGGNMGTPAARPEYMGKPFVERVDRTLEAQQKEERKGRVAPVERAAGTAGRAETLRQLEGMSPFVAGMGGANAAQIAGQAASEQVYDEAGVMSLPKAIDLRTINAIAQGIPGIFNKGFRGDLAQAGVDQPGGAMLGDIQGIAAPAMGMWNTAAAGVNALARPFIPQGASAIARGTRYAAPITGQVAGAALTNAGYQAGVAEPIRAETAGEDLTLGGMAAAAKRGLEDPINLLPVGLSAINRGFNQLTTGIATGADRAADMANRYGVGPRQTAASQGIAQTTQALGGQLQGADIRGLTNIENALRFALRDNRNIPDVNARIATGFQRIRESLPLEDDPTLNLARLIEREFAPDAPQTRDILRNFLRGVGLNSPGGGQIVGDAANQMRGQQADVLRTELESSFGAQPKTEANAAMQQSLDQFSQAYNTVLGSAPRQGPQVDRARALLAREPQSAAILDDIAQSQNLTAEQFIERNPLQALHEVQSELATQARALAARGDAGAGPLEITVRNMQRPLRDAVPGYGDLQGLWRQWTQARERMGYVRGAESGTRGELSTVPGFGDKIFGPGGIAKSEMGTQAAADVYLQMDDLSQRAAGLSVRDVINDELRKGKAAGLEERYQTAANMRRVATEGGLDALRRVFGEAGDRVARRIEQFTDANEFARNIDPEFNSATMNKSQAMATGAQPFASGIGQRAQGASNAMSESAIADSVLMLSGAPPIISAMRAPGIIGKLLQPGQRTQQNIASTLLRRGEIGSQVPPRPGGPAPITPIDPAMVPGARPPPGGPPPGSLPPTGGAPPPAPAPLPTGAPAMAAPAGAPVLTPPPVRGAGFALGPDASNALAGGTLGGIAPAESDEERLRNIAIGTGIGVLGSRTGKPGSALAGTRTAGVGGPPKPPKQADYRGRHLSPDKESGAPLHEVNSNGIYPDDVYSPKGLQYYRTATSDAMDRKAFELIQSMRGKPDATVTIYRAVPTNVEQSAMQINPNDWVTISKDYAKLHGDSVLGGNYKIVSKEVKAKDTYTAGDSWLEWGWSPKKLDDPPPIKGMGFGAGGPPKPPKPPKPDSPEAIRAALKNMAKPPKPPSRLEQMVDEGREAPVPPVNTMPSEAGAAGSKALRMLERGRTPLDIYDETSVALLPYNGANIPIVSSKMGPEELTRVFYSWLAEPPASRPAWVKRIVEDAPKKKGMMLTQKVEPPPTPPPPPLPPAGFPIGGVALGTAGGIATGVPVGIAGGALMAREQERQRRQPPPPPRGRPQ